MKICKICHEQFPSSATIDGKKRTLDKRKYCLKCSPFGQHNTRKLDLIGYRPKRKLEIGKRYEIKPCEICTRPHDWKGKICLICRVNYRRFALKDRAVKYKGGACIRCGYFKNIKALHFHHRDPTAKLFSIAGAHCKAWSIVQAELDKCDLVCANCHAEIESEIALKNNPLLQYWEKNKS